MGSGCCGQPPSRRPRAAKEAERLPRNPKLSGGVRLLYLGSGRKDFPGPQSGLTYVVSETRRKFVAHRDDAGALLKNRFVILEP